MMTLFTFQITHCMSAKDVNEEKGTHKQSYHIDSGRSGISVQILCPCPYTYKMHKHIGRLSVWYGIAIISHFWCIYYGRYSCEIQSLILQNGNCFTDTSIMCSKIHTLTYFFLFDMCGYMWVYVSCLKCAYLRRLALKSANQI